MVVFGQRFIYTENMKGTVVEKVVSKERWSRARCSFPWNYEEKGNRESGLKIASPGSPFFHAPTENSNASVFEAIA